MVFRSSMLWLIEVNIPKIGTSQRVYAVSQSMYAIANQASFTVCDEPAGMIKVSMVAIGISIVEILIQGRYFLPLLNLIESKITPNNVSLTASQTFTTSITVADLIGSIPKNKR